MRNGRRDPRHLGSHPNFKEFPYLKVDTIIDSRHSNRPMQSDQEAVQANPIHTAPHRRMCRMMENCCRGLLSMRQHTITGRSERNAGLRQRFPSVSPMWSWTCSNHCRAWAARASDDSQEPWVVVVGEIHLAGMARPIVPGRHALGRAQQS